MEFEPLSNRVIGCALEVHRTLGPGLLESAYEQCLQYELVQAGLNAVRQQPVPIRYKQRNIDAGFRIDLLVNHQLILELKSVDCFQPIHLAQLLTYMKLTSISTGLLINFNVLQLRKGIKRVVL